MYSKSYDSSSPLRSKSFSRIPRKHTSSTRVNQVEAQGEAYICFAQDFSWFQGNIITNDESNYSIYGRLDTTTNSSDLSLPESIPCTPQESEDESDAMSQSDESEGHTKRCYYKATLTDHFTGLSHNLPQIYLRNNATDPHQLTDESVFDSLEGQVDFKVVNVFKGQKADMVIQRYLGSPSLLGLRCLVYSGLMDIDFNEIIDYGRSWSL